MQKIAENYCNTYLFSEGWTATDSWTVPAAENYCNTYLFSEPLSRFRRIRDHIDIVTESLAAEAN